MGSGITSGIITNNLETLGLDNLEFDAIGGLCGTPDRGSISYNGSNG